MRNQILKKADSVLRALEAGALTRIGLEQRLEKLGIEMTKDSLQNLLSDLVELGWLERREEYYRIGMAIALYWRRCLDCEKMEMARIYGRTKALSGHDSVSDTAVMASRDEVMGAHLERNPRRHIDIIATEPPNKDTR